MLCLPAIHCRLRTLITWRLLAGDGKWFPDDTVIDGVYAALPFTRMANGHGSAKWI